MLMQSLASDGPSPLDLSASKLILSVARIRLALGDALERLCRIGGPAALGFSSMAAYAVERCGYSGRWVEEARGLARRLGGLRNLRSALERGAITWSMAQLLARHATRDNEVALVEAARTKTLRAMRAHLEHDATEPPEPAPRRTLELSVTTEDAWAYERARMIVEAVTGDRSTEGVIEAMLAETLTSILPPRAVDLAEEIEQASAMARWRASSQALDARIRERFEAEFEPLLAPRPALDPDESAPVKVPDDNDPVAVDGVIVKLAREIQGRELAVGRLAITFCETGAWRGLGYASFAHFARERLGMSRSAVMAKMALARRCEALPPVGAALSEGRIGMASAMLIGRVADEETATHWVDRAASRTFVHLREEVQAAGLLARVSGDPTWLQPPDDATLASVQDVERAALSFEPSEVQMSVADDDRAPTVGAVSHVGKIPWRVDVPADLADFWMGVRRVHAKVGDPRSFLRALSDSVLSQWLPPAEARPFEAVYRRDRYRCQSPTCDRREVGVHHIVYRARGGSDSDDNLVTLCGRCHLDGVHEDRIRVEGTAPDTLKWTFASLTVDQRTRRAA